MTESLKYDQGQPGWLSTLQDNEVPIAVAVLLVVPAVAVLISRRLGLSKQKSALVGGATLATIIGGWIKAQ